MFKFKSRAEKNAFRMGIGVGTGKRKKAAPKAKKKTMAKKVAQKSAVKPTRGGPIFLNGKFWDTNFKEPVEITKTQINRLREEYEPVGVRLSDKEVAERYVMHMRRKYGSFSEKDGSFLGLLGGD